MAETKAVYTVIKREGKDNFWINIGVAFVNKDGSLTAKLNAFPVNAELHIRDQKKDDVSKQKEW